jgi:hypothetical protein
VLFQKKNSFGPDDDGWSYEEFHELIECNGCERIRYLTYKIYDSPWVSEYERTEVMVFPNNPGGTLHRKAQDFTDSNSKISKVPDNVLKMYRETINALNSSALTLAGAGLRAIVEALCLTRGITNGNLANKINELVKKELLTKTQADLLHEERYLGNAALHELATPPHADIEDGLQIVEGLINTIYVLPEKANRLRKRREASSKRSAASHRTEKQPGTKKN